MKTSLIMSLLVIVLISGSAIAAIDYDGLNIPTDFSGLLQYTQTCRTGFGDTKGVGSGSELDQLFVSKTATGLYIGITGNLEKNGNTIVILLDTESEGSETLTPAVGPSGLMGLTGTALDPGFAPEYAFTVNNYQDQLYTNLTNLITNNDYYIGHSTVNSGVGTLKDGSNPYFNEAALNNTNIHGVTKDTTKTPAQNEADAATAATGLEVKIAYQELGISDPSAFNSVKVMAILDGSSGWLSNQTLPGLGGGYDNLAQPTPAVKFADISGDQYASVDLSTQNANEPVIDGAAIPTEGAGFLVATQNNHTGFDDRTGSAGSELDQMFLGQDSSGLQIGLTGNLDPTGDFLMIFIDGGPGGQNTIAVPSGLGPRDVLQGMNGLTFDPDFSPTHVLCVNAYQGLAYVDLVDLRTRTSAYLGHSSVDSGTGVLTGSDISSGIILAMNNTNNQGVTDLDASTASTATSGAELYLPFSEIGVASSTVKILTLLAKAGGYMSNQVFPPLPDGTANLGPETGATRVGFDAIEGDQFLTITRGDITFTPVDSVLAAKALSDASALSLQNVRVSASFPYENVFYIQDMDSPFGIKVCGDTTIPDEGSLVNVKGFLTKADGQRVLNAYETTIVEQPGSVHIKPVGMGNIALGGGTNGNNPGIPGAFGPNNIGSLVKIWGKVTVMNVYPCFYIDDGSGLMDPTGTYRGVNVYLDFDYFAFTDDFLEITGISTIAATEDSTTHEVTYERQIRARTRDDIKP